MGVTSLELPRAVPNGRRPPARVAQAALPAEQKKGILPGSAHPLVKLRRNGRAGGSLLILEGVVVRKGTTFPIELGAGVRVDRVTASPSSPQMIDGFSVNIKLTARRVFWDFSEKLFVNYIKDNGSTTLRYAELGKGDSEIILSGLNLDSRQDYNVIHFDRIGGDADSEGRGAGSSYCLFIKTSDFLVPNRKK